MSAVESISFEAIILFMFTLVATFAFLYAVHPFIKYVYRPYIKEHQQTLAQLISYLCVATIIAVIVLTPNFLTAYTSLPYTGMGSLSSKSLVVILLMIIISLFYNPQNSVKLLYLLPLYYGLHEFVYELLLNIKYNSVPFISPFSGTINYQPLVVVENFWQPLSLLLVLLYHRALIPKKDTTLYISLLALGTFLCVWYFSGLTTDSVPWILGPVNHLGQVWDFLWTTLFTVTFFTTFCRTPQSALNTSSKTLKRFTP